ncbi:MAG: hypothetical protein ACYS8Z_09535 [Planctomycetota bacterium]|jgi:hypothetical protein
MRQAKGLITLGAIAMVGFVVGQTVAQAGEKEQVQKVTTPAESKAWVPVKRATKKIALVEKGVMKYKKDAWKLDFYRNNAYKCGLSGNYTFLVVEPRNDPGKKAPLWVFFHGGGNGYFDKDGKYRTLKWQTKDTWNHEEPFEQLRKINRNHPVIQKGRLIDVTLSRRLKEGYRLLVVSYGDHDMYSGKGTPYPNNPKGGEVNGLQASMAAVEYTVANYPTTHVFAHGTSAGSVGAYALGFAFAQDGIHLTGVVMDSSIATRRRTPIHMAMAGKTSVVPKEALDIFKRESKWLGSPRGLIEKVGVMIDPEYPFHPEAAVRAGYKSVPMLILAGRKDHFFGGKGIPPVAEAKAGGLGNVEWMFDGLRQAIKEQKDSPHKLVVLNTGHVPTNKEGTPAHDEVDKFIGKAVSSRARYPFLSAQE